MIKRIFDMTLSGMVLLLLTPVFLVVGLILKFTGEKEIFYLQERIGYLGKKFKVTKFVTMVKDAPNLGSQDITIKNDPRVLPFGRILRKTKINELPQFWDVFVGRLSLVGWRPLMPRGFYDYPDWVQEKIVLARPGLTGIGSIVFRDEEAIVTAANDEGRDVKDCYRVDILPYKGALECWYIDNQSLWVDIKILLATAVAILAPNWRGYLNWFRDLPEPESNLIKEYVSES